MTTQTTQATTPWIIGHPYIVGVAWSYREATAREAAMALQDRSRHVRVMLGRPWENMDKESPQ